MFSPSSCEPNFGGFHHANTGSDPRKELSLHLTDRFDIAHIVHRPPAEEKALRYTVRRVAKYSPITEIKSRAWKGKTVIHHNGYRIEERTQPTFEILTLNTHTPKRNRIIKKRKTELPIQQFTNTSKTTKSIYRGTSIKE